ncbi:Glucose-1-phosphate thymidylyltransferase 2 [Chlamydia abortus]|uniref:Glucose-1-phosphate thymidylyltransferase n=1 Tax=Paenibacillus residui TaxID=629724 RepID=A0ABW3D8J8_9BACL|nr:Glucose-1-phosphate thymidylyltransferase 2 [Chlamydia abortus]
MKGVILAGGKGTRLAPLTAVVNKHLLPVGKYPMIHYSVLKLREAGITDILLVTGREAAGDFIRYLGSGSEMGVRLTYRVQEEAAGIANALELARPFIQEGEKFVVMLGDNLFEESLTPFVRSFEQREGAMVLLKKVDEPYRYGVPVFREGRIIRIEEKPDHPRSEYCVTGIYWYDSGVFDRIRRIVPSERGELEISDVNNLYAEEMLLAYEVMADWWIDAGTFSSLQEASKYMLKRQE